MDKKGFTLLEVLITLSILGVVLSIIYMTFNQSMLVMAAIEERADTLAKGRLILERMSRELRNTFISATARANHPFRLGLVAQTQKEKGFYRDRIDFTAFAPPGGDAGENTGHIQEIGYLLDNAPGAEGLTLFRRQDEAWDGDILRGGIRQPICPKVQELCFVFFDQAGGKHKEWNSLAGDRQGNLPTRVEIKLVIEDAQGRGRVFQTQVFLPLSGDRG
ncbi:MAG: prepilin-type N-terminal cleavage/methylation domain-containing protein [Thermodesulfobacteriota bacterium]